MAVDDDADVEAALVFLGADRQPDSITDLIRTFNEEPFALEDAVKAWWYAARDAVDDIVSRGLKLRLSSRFSEFESATAVMVTWCDQAAAIDPTPLLHLQKRISSRYYEKSVRNEELLKDYPPGYPCTDGELDRSLEQASLVVHRIIWQAQLRYYEWLRAGGEPSGLTPNGLDIWRLLRDVGHRLTTAEVSDRLDKIGRAQGSSGVKLQLAELVRRKVITNTSRDLKRPVPRGYGLPHYP